MGFRFEMRLAGEGGQGLALSARILAEAAAIYEGRNATQCQFYGPEARGGASRAEVIISEEEIRSQRTSEIDLFLALTQEALDRHLHGLRARGWLIADSDSVTRIGDGDWRVVRIPLLRAAREVLGRDALVNMIVLGVIVGLTKVVSIEAAEQAMLARIPRGTESLSRRAFRHGLDLASGP